MPTFSSKRPGYRPTGDFFSWCLSFCFAGLALGASAQSQPPDQNPNPNAPVAIPPDSQAQQFQPAPGNWDNGSLLQNPPADDEWTRHFRVGALVGLNISANFNLKSSLSLSSKGPGNYDDGYLHPSSSGLFTGDYGYNDSSQYNAVTHQLLMHQATSFAPTSGAGTGSQGGDSAYAGFEAEYGGEIWDWGRTRIGWDFGFGLLPIQITDNFSASGNVNRNIFAFDTSQVDTVGSLNVFPQPGYRGGPSSGFAIPSTPVSTSTDQVPGDITGKRDLDVILYTLRLGPSAYWELGQYFGLSAGAGPAVGIVTGHMNFNETITEHLLSGDVVVTSKGRVSGTDVVYGGYANATLMYHLVDNGDLFIGAQYMPLGNAKISGGGREAQLNLGGQIYITAGINWPF